MPRLIEGERVPIWVWARRIDAATERQLRRLASMPWVVGHVAAMADAHVSEGIAVGSVFATEHTVVPAALGGDLGCGMAAVPLGIDAASLDRPALERLLVRLASAIPVGDASHRGRGVPVDDALLAAPLSTHTLEHTRERLAGRHLGTLGGGNHFLELDRDTSGRLWVMVHSGSRGLGAAIAHHHQRVAGVGPAELVGLDVRTAAGAAYVEDVAWALTFARKNRDVMLARAVEVLAEEAGATPLWDERVDVHHNFVAPEVHGGQPLWVHRKGATSAREGELGLIPGSMGTASYVVRGKGASASLASCSHGAGRVYSRGEARRQLDTRGLARAMRQVVYDEARAAALVEEAPAAYRDIREVLEDQEGLVEPVWRLEPRLVLKG